jgi:hypothetical protein
MNSFVKKISNMGLHVAQKQQSRRNHRKQLDFLLFSAENKKNGDIISIGDREYDLNMWLQALIFTGEILIDPYTGKEHSVNLENFIKHPRINENNKNFLINFFGKES